MRDDEKTVYFAPLRYTPGEYSIAELDSKKDEIISESRKKTYGTAPGTPVEHYKGRMIYDYIVLKSFYQEVHIDEGLKITYYPKDRYVELSVKGEDEQFDYHTLYDIDGIGSLTAVYDKDGLLKNIGVSETDRRRFLYIRIDDLDQYCLITHLHLSYLPRHRE